MNPNPAPNPGLDIALPWPELARPTRRSVVQWLAAAAALAAAGCTRPPTDRIYSIARSPEFEVDGEPIYYASAWLRAGHAHGVLVGTQQGRPIKVEGHPLHPASRGGTDAQMQAAILDLWDPDRSQAVQQRRTGGMPSASTWQSFIEAWRARPGDTPLHVLTPSFTSPSMAAGLAALLAGAPGSRWYRHDALGDDPSVAGAALAFGQPLRAVHRFDRASLIVALGGDPFDDPRAGLRHAADWAQARAAAIDAERLPARLVALETTTSLFGTRADERWALTPAAIERVLWSVAAMTLPDLAGGPPPDERLQPIAARLSALLARHGTGALLWAGTSLTPASHALVHALNRHAVTPAVAWITPPDHHDALGDPGTLADLVGAIGRQQVQTLLIIGGNPAYDAPAQIGYAAALDRVPFSAHLSDRVDETSRRCNWHLPCSHAFEQWGDARACDGSVTLLQPAIAPLYDSRSPFELLAMLSGNVAAVDALSLLRECWRAQASGDFDRWWRDSLRAGVVADTAAQSVVPATARLPAAPSSTTTGDALQGLFVLDASVGDGSGANNAWLQELPRSDSHITWDNALQLGPVTARAHGVASGDVVRVQAGSASIDVPVWVQPGHAEGAATLPIGYGRSAAGRIGNGIGVDAAVLRPATGCVTPLRIERTGGRHDFARTQIETDQHGRGVARVGARQPPPPQLPTLYPPQPGEGRAWAMTIDLDACIGCNACTIAC
ncbi:MAG: hypothetical protein JSR59_11670 [Proteobacteria bacterium]|nr:hypothetical protein [Pseudomonadota bacterium]